MAKMTEKNPRSAAKAKPNSKKDFGPDQPERTANTATPVKAEKGKNFSNPGQGSDPTKASILNPGQATGSNDLAGSFSKGGIRFDNSMKKFQHDSVEHTSNS